MLWLCICKDLRFFWWVCGIQDLVGGGLLLPQEEEEDSREGCFPGTPAEFIVSTGVGDLGRFCYFVGIF